MQTGTNRFRIMGQLKLGTSSAMPRPVAAEPKPAPGVPTEAKCRGCDLFCAPQSKCAHPRLRAWPVCYGSPLRIQPWRGLRCPL